MNKRIIIIGAGPGGLATSVLLSHAGFDVTVLESRSSVGGRTTTFTENGFTFDVGPTFFLYPQILESIFTQVGERLVDWVNLVRIDPQYRLVFGSGGAIEATSRIDDLVRSIATLNSDDARNVKRLMKDNASKLHAFTPFLERAFNGPSDLFTPSLFKALPKLRPWLSLDGYLSRFFQDERVRLAFSFQSKYLGMSPASCPNLFSILAHMEYEHGVFHAMGGLGTITQALCSLGVKLGARIHTNEAVEEIIVEGSICKGVRTSKRVLKCDALVLNAEFAEAAKKLIPNASRKRWTDERITTRRHSCSTYMLYLGLEGTVDTLPHHTIYFAKDYKRNIDDIEQHRGLSEDCSMYIQNASPTDPSLAPANMSSLYVLVPVSNQRAPIDWNCDKPRLREQVFTRLDTLGVHDVRHRVRYSHERTPDDWAYDFQLYKGATFSMAHNLRQLMHLRPRNRYEDVGKMYLVGGGTHPGSGLPAIFQSAKITSGLIREDLV